MSIKKLLPFLPSLLWMGVIFYFSAGSTAAVQGTYQQRFIILKSFHIIEYAILAFLLYLPLKNIPKTILLSYFYAVSDEVHQSFTPGRSPKFTDTIIDLTGVAIGITTFIIIGKILKKRKIYPSVFRKIFSAIN